jgi:hypothetical protein
LQGFALGFEGDEFAKIDRFATFGQTSDYSVKIGAKELDVEHGFS